MPQFPNYTGGNRSSILNRLPLEIRKRLDDAIRSRQPASLICCYRDFNLCEYGVSLRALQRYARNLRDRFDLDEAAARSRLNNPDIAAGLTAIIGRRLLAILLHDEKATPATIHRLTVAYKSAHHVDRERTKTKSDEAKVAARLAKTVAEARDLAERVRKEVARADFSYLNDLWPTANTHEP
ncbi:MAG: hypothetical protein HZA51_08040 [Planctomycetes bacterium]|nr:hypothetical protein [Planctomycetota bacterium]